MNDSNAARLFAILEAERWPRQLLPLLERTRLPEWWVVAGCIAGAVWNRLTGRPPLTGIKDVDVVYFDPADLSEQGEVELVGRLRAACPDPGLPFDVKNQARVHLWYEQKFGYAIPPYPSAVAAIAAFPTTATALGVALSGDRPRLVAPFGLDDLFALVVRPNRAQITREIYEAKVARWSRLWPELKIEPW